MLDVMRSNARSSLIVVVFALIIASFIFSFGRGSSGFRTRTPETWAATVNGDLVTAGDFAQAYAQRFRQSSSARGGKYTTDDAKRDDLRRQVLRALEDQQLIAQQAKDMGITVSDGELSDAINRSPQFQQDGKFDFEYYKRLVENGYGMSVPRFEEALRRDLLRAKVVQAALNGAAVSDDEVKAFYVAQHESAAIDWVRFTGFMFRDQVVPTEAEITAYGDNGIRGVIETLPASGALLDCAGQLAGHWAQVSATVDQSAFPTNIDTVSLFGPHPGAGTRLACDVTIRAFTT